MDGNGIDEEKTIASATRLAAATLSGDLRDFVLSLVRALHDPWHRLGEEQQRRLAREIEDQIETMTAHAVAVIAARSFPAIAVHLEQVAFKTKGIEAKLVLGVTEAESRHQLVDAQGGRVVIVLADPIFFRGERGPVTIDPSEPELPLSADTGADAPEPPEPPDQVAYLAGCRLAADGVGWGERDRPYPEGSADAARFDAGWFDGFISRVPTGAEKAHFTREAADYFRQMGQRAAAGRAQPTDSPFPPSMSAHAWWNEGFFNDGEEPSPAAKKRRAGRPPKNGPAAAP